MVEPTSRSKSRGPARPEARPGVYRIGRLELDAGLRVLRRDGAALKVQPRVLDLILHLVRHRDRVVSPDELLRELWRDVHVERGSIYQAVKSARAALAEGSGAEDPIVAVYGRGYRFAAPVAEGVPRDKDAPLVGRDAELRALVERLDEAIAVARRIAFVTGEAGIGKTALLLRIEDDSRRRSVAGVATAQCLESLGEAEPYRPILESLEALCRTDAGRELGASLRRCAPAWLADLPSLRANSEPARSAPAERTHRVRELADALEQAALARPLVLLIEDLHWADPSTLDLVDTLARRSEPTRLLVVATLRPDGAAHSLVAGLARDGRAVEIQLGFLSASDVAQVLEDRFPGGVASGLAPWLHARTSGNPLFVVELLDALLDAGALRGTDAAALEVVRPLDRLAGDVPPTVRTLIERHVERFSPEDRELLEIVALAGPAAPAALVATGAGEEARDEAALERIETRLHDVMRRTGCLREAGLEAWPDGTVSGRYRFVHELHRDTLYQGVAPGRRARVHRRIAVHLEAAFAGGERAPFSVLAHHFDGGHEPARALAYYTRAIQVASRRCAREEGKRLAERALALAERVDEAGLREAAELEIRCALSPLLTRSPADPGAEANLVRAQALCEMRRDPVRLAPVLWARCYAALQRERREEAMRLAEMLLETSEALRDPGRIALAHTALAQCHAIRCHFEASNRHAELAIRSHDCERDGPLIDEVGLDLGVGAGIAGGFGLWQRGRVRDAFARVEWTLQHARDCGHEYSLVWALDHAALFYYGAAELEQARRNAKEAILLSAARGWDIDRAFGELFLAASTDPSEDRVPAMTRAVASFPAEAANESETNRVAVMTLFAEAFADAGADAQALRTIDDALAAGARLSDNPMEPALRRLRAQILLASDTRAARAELLEALGVARRLGVRINELRIASSLARLAAAQARPGEARALLEPLVAAFTGEPPVEAVAEARALLASLGSIPGPRES